MKKKSELFNREISDIVNDTPGKNLCCTEFSTKIH